MSSRLMRLLLAVAVVAAALLNVGRAAAHAELARSEPAANTSLPESPKVIKLWFTEDTEPSFTEARITDTDGRRVDAGDSRLNPSDHKELTLSAGELPQGTYTVIWSALSSVDGHVTKGSFAFGVGVPVNIAPPDPYSVQQPNLMATAVRWLNFTSSMAAAGVFPFLLWAWLPALGRLRGGQAQAAITRYSLRRAWVMTGWSIAALSIGTAGLLLVQATLLNDGDWAAALAPATLAEVLFQTRYGTVWLLRVAAIIGLATLVFWFLRTRVSRPPTPGQFWAGMALGAGVLLTSSLTGHGGATGRTPLLNVAVDWAHMIGAAVWVGGLFLLVAQLPLLSALERRDRLQMILSLIPRFSTLALSAFAVLAASGMYSSVLHVPDVQALSDTVYGNALAAKLQFTAVLGVVGLANLLFIKRQFQTAQKAGDKAADPSFRFWSLVAMEAALGAFILLAVGVMTGIMPSRQAVSLAGMRPLQAEARADDLTVQLEVTPYEVGSNFFTVRLTGTDGQPAAADRVTLRMTMQGHEMGQQEAVLQPAENGEFTASGSFLSMAGQWDTEVHVRRAGRDDAVTKHSFPVLDVPPGKLAANQMPDAASIANGPLVAGQLVVLGLVLALAAWRFGGAATSTGVTSMGLASAFLLLAGFVGGSIQMGAALADAAPVSSALIQNPFPADSRSLALGAELYNQNCLMCHGARGRGDGPAAASLRPRPVDLQVHVSQHPDGTLWTWISDGVPGTAMPSFRQRLTDEERWHILNYVKSLAAPADR